MNNLEEKTLMEETIKLQEQAVKNIEKLRENKPYHLGLAYLNQIHSKEQMEVYIKCLEKNTNQE